MADVSARDVKALRDRTGAGMMDCKAALQEAGGDVEKAVEILRVKGQAKAAKRGERVAGEGVVQSYIHANNQVGVLVEVDCETDFVARGEEFVAFARDVALHVAGSPGVQWVSDDEVPEEAREAELRVLADQAAQEGGDKPEEIRHKIA
jgi:elongation factor Ts